MVREGKGRREGKKGKEEGRKEQENRRDEIGCQGVEQGLSKAVRTLEGSPGCHRECGKG